MNTVGTRIRKLREERGIKQEIIASEMDITQSSYGRLEKDDSRLTVPKLLRIAEVLNISVSVLFGDKATNVIHDNSNNENINCSQANIGTLTYQHNKEHIATLKEEINFLRGLLEKGNL